MARTKRITKMSNRDRTLYTLHDLGRKSFKREQFVMEARAHSERAGEAWSKRASANIMSELDTLLADGVVVWDENTKECRISDDAAAEFSQHGLDSSNNSVSFRDLYSTAARHWRAVFPPHKRKTRLEYMWEYIRSCGKIDVLLQRVAVLLDEVAQHKATIDTLQRQLAATQQAERERVRAATTVIAPPTPGLSTPAVHAVEAYPTPRSEGNEDSPLLLSPLLPLVQRNRAPLTPVSNLRSAALRRRVFYAGAPLSPSPLARRVPIHADASIEADEDADESMVMGKLEVSDLQDAEDSMVLDGAPEVAGEDAEYDDEDEDPEDEEFEDMGLDEDLEPIGAFDGAPSPKRISDGTGVFMRMSDVFGNFVGEIFTTGRPRGSRERPTTEQKAQPLDAILPELSSHVPERADEAVDTGVGPSTSDIAVSTETSSYRSRAVSPVASSPDPRDAEIEELRGQVAHLKGDLECVRSTLGRRNECIEELEKQLANKQRRLQLLMSLHAQMDKEFSLEMAGQ